MTLPIVEEIRSDLKLLWAWTKSQGLPSTLRWTVLRLAVKLGFPEPSVFHICPRHALAPLAVRLRKGSDMPVFDQIFVFREYECLNNLCDPRLVLDLGANVGFSSAYFLNVFPNSIVVAIEPDPRNFECCKANLSPYGCRVVLVHGAAWSSREPLRLLDESAGDGRAWSVQVGEAIEPHPEAAMIQGWDIESLIDMGGMSSVDLLKIDIERAELSVFGKSCHSWLKRVKNICIELHGKDCEDVFFAALRDFDFEISYSGELTICRNLRPKQTCSYDSSESLLTA